MNARPTDLTGPGVQVLLVGVSRYPAADQRYLPDVPAVETTVEDLRDTLISRCGVAPESITVLLNPAGPYELHAAIVAGVERSRDVFLLYFAGHGNRATSRRGSAFYLGTAASDQRTEHMEMRWLDFAMVSRSLESAVGAAVVVLDCCFSGSAELANEAHYLLASAGRDEFALAPAGARHTTFTGRLIELLRDGVPTGPYALTLDDLYRDLARTLEVRPHRRSGDRVQNLLVAHNAAHRAPEVPLVAEREGTERDEAADAACPYPGLAPYGTELARYFHGRDADVAALADRIQESGGPFLLIGPSGFGKSSLLRAGLIPEVRRRGIDGRAAIEVVVEPGGAPLAALAGALARAAGRAPEEAAAALEADPATALHGLLRPALGDQGRALLVVDQFEAVFSAPEAEREAFIRAVLPPDPGPVRTVLAVRPEFTEHCVAHPPLADLLNDGPYFLRPMGEPELREAIRGPARAAGLDLQDGLVELLLEPLRAGRAPALPQLSYALTATWLRKSGRVLTVAAYRETGGIAGALWQAAEEADRRLTDPERRVARRMLLALLVSPDEGTVLCRTVPLVRLLDGEDGRAAGRVLEVLTGARLLTVDTERHVSIVHDSLTTSWPLLSDVIAANRDWIRRRGRLEADAAAWRAAGDAKVYRGDILTEAVALARSRDDVPPLITAFLAAGEAVERRARRRVWRLVAALSVALVLVASTAVAALRQADAAERANRIAVTERDTARSQRLGQTAVNLAAARPNLAGQLAVLAYRVAPTPEARAALFALQDAPTAVTLGASVQAVGFRPDGGLMAVAARRRALLWDVARGAVRGALNWGDDVIRLAEFVGDGGRLLTVTRKGGALLWDVSDPDRPVVEADLSAAFGRTEKRLTYHAVALSPDRRRLATVSRQAGEDRALVLWDVADPAHPRRLSAKARIRPGSVENLVFSPGGTMVATTVAGEAQLWDVSRPDRPRRTATIDYGAGTIYGLAFSPDGRWLATGDGNIDDYLDGVDSVRLWDISTPTRPRLVTTLIGHTNFVYGLVFSPDGSLLLSAANDTTVRVWDVHDPAKARLVRVLTEHTGGVNDVGFLRDGSKVYTASKDGSVRLWDAAGLARPGGVASFTTAEDTLRDVAFSPDGRTLAVAAMDGTARIWSVADRRRPVSRRTLLAHDDWVNSVVFSPDGRRLFTAGSDAYVVVSTITPDGDAHWVTEFTPDPGKKVWRTAVSPDGRVLATSGGTPALWDVATPVEHEEPALLARLPADTRTFVKAVAFSDDGTLLAVGDQRGDVQVYRVSDPRRPERLATFHANNDEASTLAFRPGGHILAVAGANALERVDDERRLALWDLSRPWAPRLLAVLHDRQDWIAEVAFSPDGTLLAAAGHDVTRVWDVADPAVPHLLATFDAHADDVAGVAFGPGGLLATASRDRKVVLYDTAPERLAARLCASAGAAAVTEAEWAQYLPGEPYRPPCGPSPAPR
ncbi:hypothetical protein Sme01_69900 [Sphaerisporangium melleum]|uniref:Peptidase C14 caspase domain-containing protein n=1 Tax=Sphaerisporangium melleum TaxID=321316 RepID=A0A917RKZ4_9ACTN|nr:caspase family protein [Sphaerisporangium melleum]GGL13543.1 hypothetical protein GCM10007964_64560 [Sphaerisporangium melleum]GII74514.1 hypothetical protein Sme01_69900 [Sphaerisporangium melleum]